MVWSPLAGGLLSGKYGPGAPDGNNAGRRAKFAFPPVDEDRGWACVAAMREVAAKHDASVASVALARSEEHTSELQSLMRISYAVFCLKKKQTTKRTQTTNSK